MKIIPITLENAHIFEVFVQDYEAEFSAITKKEPDAEGRFVLEADWQNPNKGFYPFVEGKPVGFAIRGQTDEGHPILPSFTSFFEFNFFRKNRNRNGKTLLNSKMARRFKTSYSR